MVWVSCNNLYQIEHNLQKQKQRYPQFSPLALLPPGKGLGVVLKKLNKFHVPEKFLLSLLSTWHMSLPFKRTKVQNNPMLQTKQAILYISCELLSHCPITLFPFILKLLKVKSPLNSFFHNPNPIYQQVPY